MLHTVILKLAIKTIILLQITAMGYSNENDHFPISSFDGTTIQNNFANGISSTLQPLDEENLIFKSINDDDKIIVKEYAISTELPTIDERIIPTIITITATSTTGTTTQLENPASFGYVENFDIITTGTTATSTTTETANNNNYNNNNNHHKGPSLGRQNTTPSSVPANLPNNNYNNINNLNNNNNNNNKHNNNNNNNINNNNNNNNALNTAATTVRTYLGMQLNITNSKLSLPLTRSASSSSSSLTSSTNAQKDNSGSSSNSNSHSNININSRKISSSSSSSSIKQLILPKPQRTDAPMLNYIFDSISTANKHHHHDQRYGPHFEDIRREGNITNITVQAGSTVQLNCRISLLQDKTVSWVKRNSNGGEEALELLTVGVHTYSGDNRFTMEFQYPSNWRLKISNARKSDEGTYECQISTHPPRVIQINLHVNAPKVMIVDEYGTPLQEKYYEIDSTLQLSCIVRNVVMTSSVVYWSHGDQTLNYDLTRGGVSVKTELMEHGANSTLFIARINKSDSGNYTCSINSSHEYNIVVHILNGESFAELHHGNSLRFQSTTAATIFYVILLIFTLHRIQISIILR